MRALPLLALIGCSETGFSSRIPPSASDCEPDDPRRLPLPDWTLHGDATHPSGDDWIVLARPERFMRGTAVYDRERFPSDDLEVSLRFAIGGGNGADGISLTLLDVDRATDLVGFHGGGLAYDGLPGWSVEVDVYENDKWTDPTADDHVAVHLDGNPSAPEGWISLPEIEDTGWHDLHVQVQGSRFLARVDDTVVVVEAAPQEHFDGVLALTGSTGWQFHEHRVADVTLGPLPCP